MVVESRTIQILDPRPEEVPEARGLSGRLPSLDGKVVGLLENRKYHADAFLQELQKVLETEYGAGKVVYARKFTFSAPCADETIDSLIEECDAVVHGIADWGSCTAWGLHDTVVTESRGVPSVSVITSAFTRAARTRAASLGMPDVPIVVLPSPLASRSVEGVQQLAHEYAREIVERLTQG